MFSGGDFPSEPLPRIAKRLIVSTNARSCRPDLIICPIEKRMWVLGLSDCHFLIVCLRGQIARTNRPNAKNSSRSWDFGASRPTSVFLRYTQPNSSRNWIILCVCLLDTHRTGPMAALSSEVSAELMRERVPQTEDIEWFRIFFGLF